MSFEIKKWGSFEKVGQGHAFWHMGKFYAILETKVGAYRGNHIHPHDQYSLLLSGRARYVEFDGVRRETQMKEEKVVRVKAGIPHILLPEEDITTFEWWDGEFIAEDCSGIFEDLTKGRFGTKD